jgi:hypothetical protein
VFVFGSHVCAKWQVPIPNAFPMYRDGSSFKKSEDM